MAYGNAVLLSPEEDATLMVMVTMVIRYQKRKQQKHCRKMNWRYIPNNNKTETNTIWAITSRRIKNPDFIVLTNRHECCCRRPWWITKEDAIQRMCKREPLAWCKITADFTIASSTSVSTSCFLLSCVLWLNATLVKMDAALLHTINHGECDVYYHQCCQQ